MDYRLMKTRVKRWGFFFLLAGYTWIIFQMLLSPWFHISMLGNYLFNTLGFLTDLFACQFIKSNLIFFLIISLIPTLIFIGVDLLLEEIEKKKGKSYSWGLRVILSMLLLALLLLFIGQPSYRN